MQASPTEALIERMLDGQPIDWDSMAMGAPADRFTQGLRGLDEVFAVFSRFSEPGAMGAMGAPQEGFRFAQLQVQGLIGAGSQGEVYRAFNPMLQMPVALKLFPAGDAPHWLAEARQLARLQHPHIVRIHGAAIENGRAGLWMDLVDGGNLRTIVDRSGPLPAAEAIAMTLDLADALAAMHAAGILHGDIKAENVLRDGDGHVVLTDFGAAHGLGRMPWLLLGTANYLAPELLAGDERTPAHDRYALNVLLYFLLSGSFPVPRQVSPAAEPAALPCDQPAIPLRAVAPHLPARICRVVDRELALSPQARHASLEDYTSALRRSLRGPRRTRRLTVLAGLFAAALSLALSDSRPPAPIPPATTEVSFVADSGDGLRPVADGARLDPAMPLLMRLNSVAPSWVYIVNRDGNGRQTLLFPHAELKLSNPLPAGTTWLPGAIEGLLRGWALDGSSSTEDFLVIVSPGRSLSLEDALRSIPALPLSGPTRGVGGLAPAPANDRKALERLLQAESAQSADLRVWRYRFHVAASESDQQAMRSWPPMGRTP